MARHFAPVLGCLLFAGCGSADNFATAPVKGVVTCKGQPVSGGTINFSPITMGKDGLAGKPASGTVGTDGTFILTTYHDNDGAVVGKHRVIYSLPSTDGPVPKFPCANSAPIEVEVKAGSNDLKIEF
ncbi:MAG: hypothetical protein C0478_05920 [Planctomyces sp.]|nr:hypothetical protein [Planctomyces sp.]